MESSDSREPSYYEVALTNRQVLVAFVALLSCLLAAFLSGVWLGRGGATAAPARPQLAQAPTPEPQLEQLTFFSAKEPGARATAPAPRATATPAAAATAAPAPEPEVVVAPAATDEPEAEALRRNLEGAIDAGRVESRPPTPAPTAAPRATATAAARAAEPAPAGGRFFVQVYSSTNAPRARQIVADLRKAGFQVVLSEPAAGTTGNYRVRVGPYENRERAEAAAKRLQREHRLDYWVTDTP